MAANAIIVNDKSNVYSDIGIAFADEWMKTEDDWAEDAKRLLRAEMTRRGVTYEGLVEELKAVGVTDTAVNLRNKVARGKFSAAFLLQCLTAIGATNVRISDKGNAD